MNNFLETMAAPPEVEAACRSRPARRTGRQPFIPREKKKQFKRDKRDVHGWLVL